jgi:signal peptidase II
LNDRLISGGDGEKKVIFWSVSLAVFLVILDQASKMLVVRYIPEHDIIPIIPYIFNLTYLNNPGAAWGILAGKGNLLLAFAIVVFAGIIYFLRALCEGWTERYFALFMVLSGIVGNSIDRVWHGQVVDFLDFYIKDYHWPSFNVADSAITVGVTIFIISSLFRPQAPKKEKEPVEPESSPE